MTGLFFAALIRQFFTEVDWGETLDYLVIDTPPGTSDEHLSTAQFLKDIPGVIAVVVSTPQEVSLLDVRKEINFLRKVNIPIVGVIENMSTFICPKCKVSCRSINFVFLKCHSHTPTTFRLVQIYFLLILEEY